VNAFPDARFFLVGYGKGLAETIRFRNVLGLSNHVDMFNVMEQGRLLKLLNRCTLFVLPSLSEGLPSTVLEAMSCGKPVVLTANIGLEEVVGDAGLYFPRRDSKALANAIVTLLANKELGDELGKRGRERVRSSYDWPQIVEKVNALYTKVIENKRRSD
jgi:glycosyltransferase involved in cell wall biosynthesis